MYSLLNIAKPALLNSFKVQATRVLGSTALNTSSAILKRSYHENVIILFYIIFIYGFIK